MKFRFVSHRKHSVSVRKTDQRTLYKEIIAVCCGNLKDHINTIAWSKFSVFIIKPEGT
jgi:hypothetical protein